MTASLPPLMQWITAAGALASGYKLYSYLPGTTTPLATYYDEDLSSARTNPVVLNANGAPHLGGLIFLLGQKYKFVLHTDADVEVDTWDDYDPEGQQLHTIDEYAGATDSAKLIAGLTAGDNIKLTRNVTLLASASLAARQHLDLGGYTLTKGFNGDMISAMGNYSSIANGTLDGDGGSYTGRGLVIAAGNYQRLINVNIWDTASYCLEFTVDSAGTGFRWIGGLTYTTDVTTTAAIKLPASETATGGLREFISVGGGGGHLIDFSAGKTTGLHACDGLSVTFGDNCTNVFMDGNTRIVNAMTVKGDNHQLFGLYGAAMTLASGCEGCNVFEQTGYTITNSSGNSTNNIWSHDKFRWSNSSPFQTIAMGGENAIALAVTGTSAGARFRLGVDSSANAEFYSLNSVNLELGVDTPDDLVISTTKISASIPVMPAVTETTDLGSASFEWNNIYTQNAVTVSDARRKVDLGVIDGQAALDFIAALTPRWFAFKPTTIPAREREVNETYIEHEERKVRNADGDVIGTEQVPVEKVRTRTITEPERTITHGRRHAGFFAQELRVAMDATTGDFGLHAYDPAADAHELRLNEQIAILTAGMKRLAERLSALEDSREDRR